MSNRWSKMRRKLEVGLQFLNSVNLRWSAQKSKASAILELIDCAAKFIFSSFVDAN